MSNFVGSVPSVDGIPLSGFIYPEDTFAESTGIGSYREGVSTMKVSGAADWTGSEGSPGVVRTIRSGSMGRQEISFDFGDNFVQVRTWIEYASAWDDWIPLLTTDALSSFVPYYEIEIPEDAIAEGGAFGDYPDYRISLMPVTAGANWGPDTGAAGHVVTERNGSDGKQTFHQYSNKTSYTRTYTGSAWSVWIGEGGQYPEDTFTESTGISSYREGISVMPVSAVADWNGLEVAATVTTHRTSHGGWQTLAVKDDGYWGWRHWRAITSDWSIWRYPATGNSLDAINDVVNDHLNDTTDAHDATAISYAGSTNLAATQVEAALDELDTEKASTGSVTTVQTNLDNHTGDISDAHDASAISILDTAAQYTATNAEDALAEVLDALQAHEADATAAHAATAISFTPNGSIAATTVQAAIVEVRDEATGGTGLSLTEVETNLGAAPRTSGKFNITSSGLTTGKHVLITQANGPYTGKGTLTDEAQMDAITATGKVTSATNIECYWRSPTKVRGNVKFAYAVG